MRRYWLVAILAAGYGCAVGPTVGEEPEAIEWPAHWPRPGIDLLAGTRCPDVAGVYAYGATVWDQVLDGNYRRESEEKDDFAARRLIALRSDSTGVPEPHAKPSLEERPATVSDRENLGGAVRVEQEPQTLKFILLSGRRDLVQTATLQQDRGDFHCGAGFIVFQSRATREGYSEGVAQRFRFERRLTKAGDGTLILHSKTTNYYTQMLFIRGIRVVNAFVRFEPLVKK